MKLTPLDIRKQDFSRKFRGFDPEEVQAFLNMASSQWESLIDERQELENKLTELRAKIEHYEKVEMALEEALRITRESSEKTIRNAENKARNLIDKADKEARRTEEQARKTVNEIRRQALQLNDYRLELIARLRALLTSETELLARYEEHANVVLGRLYAAGEDGAEEGQLPESPPAKTTDPPEPKESAPAPPPHMEADTETDAETASDAPRSDPAPKTKEPKNKKKVAGEPNSSSDIQHIRRILKDLD